MKPREPLTGANLVGSGKNIETSTLKPKGEDSMRTVVEHGSVALERWENAIPKGGCWSSLSPAEQSSQVQIFESRVREMGIARKI